jgi:hypothetical protein
MADTPKLTVSTDLAIVVNGDCGCFWKFYFELETSALWVDSDCEPCYAHKNQAQMIEASNLAKAEATRIRSKLTQ